MTSFVHIEYSNQHAGLSRIESAIESAQHIKRTFSSTRSLAMLLLSAIAAAVMVVAYQVMDSMAEGQLLALWTGMWVAAFVVLAIFANTARRLVISLKAGLDDWSRSIAEARADQRLWAMAKADARVMADLQAARARDDANHEGLRFAAPPSSVGNVAQTTVAQGAEPLAPYQRIYI